MGYKSLAEYSWLPGAKHAFEDLFLEKTLNNWYSGAPFVNFPKSYHFIILENHQSLTQHHGIPSKLDKRVQELVELLFDFGEMKKMMDQFELDAIKMPLSHLSEKQILSAFDVLPEWSNLIENGGPSCEILEAWSDFTS